MDDMKLFITYWIWNDNVWELSRLLDNLWNNSSILRMSCNISDSGIAWNVLASHHSHSQSQIPRFYKIQGFSHLENMKAKKAICHFLSFSAWLLHATDWLLPHIISSYRIFISFTRKDYFTQRSKASLLPLTCLQNLNLKISIAISHQRHKKIHYTSFEKGLK